MTGRPLRFRSKKQAAVYIHRRRLVARLLEERPWCEIQWGPRCQGRAVDVDEKLSRAAGGSLLDESNLQTVCRWCHEMKHTHPAEAVERGFTIQRRTA